MARSEMVDSFPTALGWMSLHGRGKTLIQLTFGYRSPSEAVAALDQDAIGAAREGSWSLRLAKRLQAFAEGTRDDFSDVKLDWNGRSEFQQAVLARCREIPFGTTMTYGELAEAVSLPLAARAVGNCMASNRTPLIVPCHRVVALGGRLGGYSAGEGTRMKLRLLELEGARECVVQQ